MKLDPGNWETFQQFLLQCLMVEPGTFVPVLSHLLYYRQAGFAIDRQAVEEVMNHQIVFNCPHGHSSEVAWAIWTLIVFGLPIDGLASQAISRMDDSVIALLALDAQQRGLIPRGLDTTLWQSYMETAELRGKQWLLAYESNVKGWLPSNGNADHVAADPDFGHLKRLGVEFYNSAKVLNAAPTFASTSSGAAPAFSAQDA